MTGLVASSIRRIAGVFGVLAVVGLVAVPVALANNDTINVTATVGEGSAASWATRRGAPRSSSTNILICL